MTIPFGDIFQKVKARLFPLAETKSAPSRIVPVEKSSGQRLSKTVLPKAARARTAADPFQAAAGAGSIEKVMPAAGPRSISFDPGRRPSVPRELPKKVAIVQEQPVERAISLQLADILDQLPGDCIKPAETFDASRAIVLKASEIEKGMASGKPSVSLASIYEQAPEIFLNGVAPGDPTSVLLPFAKVLEQFQGLQVRADQVHDNSVPQLETPFLKVTLEDTERFGTTMQPLQTSSHPPVKVEPAMAETLAAAEPEPVVSGTARPKPSLRPTIPLRELDLAGSTSGMGGGSSGAADKQPRKTPPGAPPKIPFHLPPNGTGEPASEKVPASSGPSVPTTPATPPAPSRIPFKFSAPCEDIRPKFTLVPGVEPNKNVSPVKKSTVATNDGAKVALSLQSILQGLPAFQLNGSPMSVSEDARIEFPLSLIEPQLASGRVMVPAKVFQRAIPEMHRELFVVDLNETPVSLALPEVLKHLPPATLRMREDQEEMALKEKFTTPFSIQAEEDAKRFNAPAATVSQVSDKPAEESKVDLAAQVPAEAEKIETEPEAEKIDAKQAISLASALPGVAACSITFADGLSLAGNIPAELGAEGICAMAPSLLQRIDNHLPDTKLGSLNSITLHCAKSPLTFFMSENICLMALHTPGGELTADTRDQLATVVQELSRTYSQPDHSHVDH